jgi:hypothetical protein
MFYELPMTGEIIAKAKAVIVHSLYAAIKVQAQRPATPVVRIRHHVSPAALKAGLALSREAARAALAIDNDTLLMVSMGFVTKAKQVDTVLRFMAKHRHTGRKLCYLIAGQDNPDEFDVRSLISSLGLDDVVRVTGFVDEPSFYCHVRAADIVVNLRYPSGGETSGTLIRALGAGSCVIVNDIGPFSEFPDDVCAKVPIHSERHDLEFERVITQLIESPARRLQYSARAARYISHAHDLQRSAEKYRQTLAEHGDRDVKPSSRFTAVATMPPARTESLLASLPPDERADVPAWATRGPVPMPSAYGKGDALCLGTDEADVFWLMRLFGYKADYIERRSELPTSTTNSCFAAGKYELVLLRVVASEQINRLGLLLGHVNVGMVWHGVLLLVVETQTDHAIDRQELSRILRTTGFAVDSMAAQRQDASFALDERSTPTTEGLSELVCCMRKVSHYVALPEPSSQVFK